MAGVVNPGDPIQVVEINSTGQAKPEDEQPVEPIEEDEEQEDSEEEEETEEESEGEDEQAEQPPTPPQLYPIPNLQQRPVNYVAPMIRNDEESNQRWAPILQRSNPNSLEEGGMFFIPDQDVFTRGSAFDEQNEFMIRYVQYVIASCNKKTIEYSSDDNRQEVYIRTYNITTTIGRCGMTGWAVLSCTALLHSIRFTGMNYVLAASMIFEHFVVAFENQLDLLCPMSIMLSPGYPSMKLQTKSVRFDGSNPLCETHFLPRWMPHVDMYNRIDTMNIGNTYNHEDNQRVARVYEKYFRGRITGWEGGYHVDVALVNYLRKNLPRTIISQTNIPFPHVLRWIKGWMCGLNGYTHIKDLIYSPTGYRINPRVLRFFTGIQEQYGDPEYTAYLTNPEGHTGLFRWHRNGMVQFVNAGNRAMQFEKNQDHGFDLEELVDDERMVRQFIQEDLLEFQKNHDYVTMTGHGELF